MNFKSDDRSFYKEDASGERIAEVTYSPAGETMLIIDHTFVDDSLRGQNIAHQLVYEVIKKARKEGKKIIPLCPFAKLEFEKHPEYHDVLQ
ncbi:GNAT family N-acetyltransferase [Vagococcus acidifermentans]|uniref:GNAT family N-acetyltransferase n=1 Tax=Vagococcus acidifermentans TaxID=564710 RepID=A0A430B2R5_9ENTE|nr:GNAT family N-acetyltransferase [Vagococcus acidifermentans]RSU14620.1 GNAT family N-acetyltransferase [Vagococcus acidifermentans]